MSPQYFYGGGGGGGGGESVSIACINTLTEVQYQSLTLFCRLYHHFTLALSLIKL